MSVLDPGRGIRGGVGDATGDGHPRRIDGILRGVESLERLAELDDSLRLLGTFEESLARLADLGESVDKLALAVESLPGLAESAAALPS